MPDVTYDIISKSNGTLSTEFNTGDPNNWTRGQTASFTFELPDFDPNLTVRSGESYTVSSDETRSFVRVYGTGTLTIDSGATLTTTGIDNQGTITNNGTIVNTAGFGFGVFQSYADFAGSYSTLSMLNNTERYRIQIPADALIDSLVWGIEPNQELEDRNVVGVWGLVENIQNQRNQPLTTNRYQVDIRVLAPLDEYDTLSDAEADLVI